MLPLSTGRRRGCHARSADRRRSSRIRFRRLRRRAQVVRRAATFRRISARRALGPATPTAPPRCVDRRRYNDRADRGGLPTCAFRLGRSRIRTAGQPQPPRAPARPDDERTRSDGNFQAGRSTSLRRPMAAQGQALMLQSPPPPPAGQHRRPSLIGPTDYGFVRHRSETCRARIWDRSPVVVARTKRQHDSNIPAIFTASNIAKRNGPPA